MDKILVIEDSADIRELLQFNLSREGYEVYTAMTGEEGLVLARVHDPVLILLDLVLPGIRGLEVCKRLKREPRTESIPIIMLTAKSEETDIVLGLEMGADDYVTKPFGIKELAARIRTVLRRTLNPVTAQDGRIRVGPLEIDSERFQVRVEGQLLTLTLTEFRLLQALAENPGRVFTREQLLDRITEGKTVIIDRNVDVHIRALRKKLGSRSSMILTVRGVGYKLLAES